MNYEQTLEFLYSRLPMFSRTGADAIKPGLSNTKALCASLGDPQQYFRSVHIAGTNGKGSTSHMLAAVMQKCGYRTGLYTSPHLSDFRERIRVNGEMIPKDYVAKFTERIKTDIDTIDPSFFEVTVAMAFQYFKEAGVEIAIIETGLGGRLDSTNIIIPELSIITNIGMDHMHLLGNTLEAIAGEKAGIIKPNVPVVVGEYLPSTKRVFDQTARASKSSIFYSQDQWTVSALRSVSDKLLVTVMNNAGLEFDYLLDLPAHYQQKNLLTVLSSLECLRSKGFNIPAQTVFAALQEVKKLTGLRGRWDVIGHNPLRVMDVAHNEDGIREVLKQVSATPHNKLHIIIGMVKDKDIASVLKLMPESAHYYFTQASVPRAMGHNDLANLAATFNLRGHSFENVNMAFAAAEKNAIAEDLILICGSVFIAGELETGRASD